MSSHDKATPVAQQGPRDFFSEQRPLQTGNTTDGRFRKEFDLRQKLRGPATFIRIVATDDCELFFWDQSENEYKQYFEGTVPGRGLIANEPLRIINENWEKIQVIGPSTATLVTVYASRIPDTTGQDFPGGTSPPS